MRMTTAATDPACAAVWHGTGHAFVRYGCRCPEARADRRSKHHVIYSRSTSGARHGREHANHRQVDPESVQIAVTRQQGVARVGAAERRLVVAELTERGKSATEIAHRLGIAPRSVARIRQRIREAAS